MMLHYQRLATLVTARQLEKPVSRDPDDDAVLACALAARPASLRDLGQRGAGHATALEHALGGVQHQVAGGKCVFFGFTGHGFLLRYIHSRVYVDWPKILPGVASFMHRPQPL